MNWAAWGPTIIAVITAIFVFGKTAGRIDDQEKTLSQHHDRLGIVENKTIEHSIQIAEAKGWREGFKAGGNGSPDGARS